MTSMLSEAPAAKLRLSQNLSIFPGGRRPRSTTAPATFSGFLRKRTSVMPIMAMSSVPLQHLEKEKPASPTTVIPIMVNGCSGKMGKAVIMAAESAGLYIVPVSFGSEEESGKTVEVCGKDILVHGPSDRERVLASMFDKYPNLIVVDYTAPSAVMESHQASKLDTSGTAKVVVSCFQKMGVAYDVDQIQMIRNPEDQIEMVGVPEEHLNGQAFHLYNLTPPDKTVSFEFQHNVCGRSIYAEGTVDALLFLAKKVQSKAEKRIYNMIDVLREGSTR